MLKKMAGPGMFRLFLAELVFADHVSRFDIGGASVFIFFCLSGYWIYKMFSGRYLRARRVFLTYAVSRLWRLLPTFWLVSLIAFLCLAAQHELTWGWKLTTPTHFILSNLFIFGYRTLPLRPLGPAWSLDIEMQFYCIAPLLALLLIRRRISAPILVATSCGTALAVIYALHAENLFCYLPFFVMGMAAAATDWKPSGRFTMIASLALVFGTIACLFSPWSGILLLGSHPGPLAIYNTHAQVAIALLAFPFAIFTTRQVGFSFDGMCADLSYIVYLLHYPFITIPYVVHGSFAHKLLMVFLVWILVSVLSLLIWRFYDHPINRLRSLWVKRQIG